MSATATYPVQVCVDCALLAANDDDSGAREGARAEYVAGIEDWARELGSSVSVIVGDREPHFVVMAHCGVCGSRISGDYVDAVVVAR